MAPAGQYRAGGDGSSFVSASGAGASKWQGATGSIAAPSVIGSSENSYGVPGFGGRRRSALTRALESARNGLFGVLFVMAKDAHVSAVLVIIEMIVDFVQLLSFNFNAYHTDFPWNPTQTDWFEKFVRPFAFETYVGRSAPVFYVIITIIVLLLANAAFVGYSFSRSKYRMMWPLRLLRTTSGLVSTVCFIPFTSILAVQLTCETGEPCWSGVDLLKKILAIVFGLGFIFLAFLMAICVCEQDPNSRSVFTRPHSRVDLYLLAVRALFSIMFALLDHSYQWVLIIALLIGSITSALVFTWFQPWYRFNYLAAQVSMLWVWGWASVCLLVAKLSPSPDENQASLFFFMTSPLVVVTAIVGLRLRRRQIERMPVDDINNAVELELRIRYHLASKGALFRQRNWSAEKADKAETAKQRQTMLEVNEWYRAASKRIPRSSLLHLFWSNHHMYITQSRQLALAELTIAEDLGPKFDEAFIIYRRRKMMEDEETGGRGDVIQFITYQKHFEAAQRNDLRCTVYQLRFWAEIIKHSPDIVRMHKIADSITQSLAIAQKSYSELVRMNPNSPQTLRMYAGFLMDVAFDAQGAEALLTRATDIEESGQNDTEMRGDSILNADASMFAQLVSDSRTASVTISGEHGMEGIIQDSNAAACKLLGYRPRELNGRNVIAIIPCPFSANHNTYIRNYLETGETKFLDRIRLACAVHRSGYIVPIHLGIRQTCSVTGGMVFVGHMRPVTSADQYVLVDLANGTITGCTASAGGLLGIGPELFLELQHGALSDETKETLRITRYLADFSTITLGGEAAASAHRTQIQLPSGPHSCVVLPAFVESFDAAVALLRISLSDSSESFPTNEKRPLGTLDSPHELMSAGVSIPSSPGPVVGTGATRGLAPSTGAGDGMRSPARSPQPSPRYQRQLSSRTNSDDRRTPPTAAVRSVSSYPSIPQDDHVRGGLRDVSSDEIPMQALGRTRSGRRASVSFQEDAKAVIPAITVGQPSEVPGYMGEDVPQSPRRSVGPEGVNVEIQPVPEEGPFAIPQASVDSYNDAVESDSVSSGEEKNVTSPHGLFRVGNVGGRSFDEGDDFSNLAGLDCNGRPEDAAERGSIASSSTNSSNAFVARARNSIMTNGGRGLGLTGTVMRVALLLTIAGLITISVMGMIVFKKDANDLTDEIGDVTLAAQRRIESHDVIDSVRLLMLMRANITRPFSEAEVRGRLAKAAADMYDTHETLYQRFAKMTAEQRNLYTVPSISAVITNSRGEATTRLVNLWDMVNLFAARAKLLGVAPLDAFVDESPEVRFILDNAVTSLRAAFEQSMYYYEEEATKTRQTLEDAIHATYVAGIVFSIAMTLLILIPLYAYAEKTNSHVIELFFDIPKHLARGLQENCTQRLQSRSDLDDGIDVFEENMPTLTNNAKEKDDKKDGKKKSALSRAKPVRRGEGVNVSLQQRLRLFLTNQRFAIIATLLVLIAAIAYTCATYDTELAFSNEHGHSATEINWSNRRHYRTRLGLLSARELAACNTTLICGRYWDIGTSAISTARDINQYLLYTNASIGITQMAATIPALATIMFSDACGLHGQKDDCRTFDGGVMNNGLNSALFDFWQRTEDALYDSHNVSIPKPLAYSEAYLNMPSWTTLERYLRYYLVPALKEATYMYDTTLQDDVDKATKDRVVGCIVYGVLLGVFYLFVLSRIPGVLDKRMRRAHMILLTVPPDVLKTLEGFEKLIRLNYRSNKA